MPSSGDHRKPPRDSPNDLLSTGDRVDQFKVIKLLGKGGMGEVYLARDTTLGRKVAVKMIRRTEGMLDRTVKRFLFEAQAAANLNHPNIVTIFQAGQHDGRPFVAMEYLPGDNLRDRLRGDPPGEKEAMRLCLDVARALEVAHARKIVHRDLKPENLLIPADGRLRVVDFGLARIMDRPLDHETSEELSRVFTKMGQLFPDTPSTLQGTPQYMAPEQWLQLNSSGATDIWALGTLLHELLTGERPMDQFTFVELATQVAGGDPVPLLFDVSPGAGSQHPPELVQLVRDCLAKEASQRPAASEVVETLEALLARGNSRLDSEASPFRGLAPFGEQHAEQFFGRDAELLEFMEKLRHQAVLPVVGPSGAGKSSFVQAGVIPRLREQGGWTVLRMRPGEAPFRALAARLAMGETRAMDSRISHPNETRAPEAAPTEAPQELLSGLQTLETTLAEEEALAQELQEKPHLLSLALRRLAAQQGGKVLLLVDQLEELYTLTADMAERRAFMEAICGAADEESDPVRVIFTLREDFLSRLTLGPLVRVVMGQLTVMLWPEARALKQTLIYPLELQGYSFDDDLLPAEMVREVRGERAALPLLQFAARHLWEKRDRKDKLLCRADFEAMGGVAGALASHADGVVESLEQAEQEAARELLLRLVTPARTRQVVGRKTLLDGLGPGGEVVLQRLVTARLLTAHRGAGVTGGIELVAESLIHSWHRLARWLEESREDLIFLEEAGRAADLWNSRGRRQDEVWAGQALLEAEAALARCTATVPDTIQLFIQAGKRRRDRASWRLRGLGALLLVMASLAAVIFFGQKQEADKQRAVAEAQRKTAGELLGQSLLEGARAALARGERLEAKARLRSSLRVMDATASRGLWWRLSRDPLTWTRNLGSIIHSLSISPDSQEIAAGCLNGAVYLIDRRTRTTQVMRGFGGQILGLAHSPDGKWLAVGTSQHRVHLRHRTKGTERVLHSHEGSVRALAFSPDSKHLATGGDDLSIVIHDLSGGAPVQVDKAHNRPLWELEFSPDGEFLASTSGDPSPGLWQARDGALVRRMASKHAPLAGLTFLAGGQILAVGGGDNAISLWDVASGALVDTLRGHQGRVSGLDASPDGKLLASSSLDKTVRLWDVASGKQLRVLAGHALPIQRLRYAPDNSFLATASVDRTVKLWSPQTETFEQPQGGHTAEVVGADISPDGETIATAGYDNTVRLWGRRDGKVKRTLHFLAERMVTTTYSPDGNLLAMAGDNGIVYLRDARTGEEIRSLHQHKSKVTALAFTPDSKHLMSTSMDGETHVWDTSNGTLVRTMKLPKVVKNMRVSPDGQTIGEPLAHGRALLRGRDGAVRHTLRGHRSVVNALRFSPKKDHPWAITTSDDGTVRLWNTRTGRAGWFTVVMTPELAKVLTHRGWEAMGGHDQVSTPPVARWASAAQREGRLGDISGDGDRLCQLTHGGKLELWDLKADRKQFEASEPKADRVLAVGGGCLVRSGDESRLYKQGGSYRKLSTSTEVIAAHGKEVMVAAEGKIQIFDQLGQRKAAHEVGTGITALGVSGPWLVAGFREGSLELHSLNPATKRPKHRFEDLPAVPVERIIAGPGDTLAVGFASGVVGLWDRDSGALLHKVKLHGPVVHLRLYKGKLFAASDLGDHTTLDLAVFYKPYKELRKEVESKVPVVWKDGRVQLAD